MEEVAQNPGYATDVALTSSALNQQFGLLDKWLYEAGVNVVSNQVAYRRFEFVRKWSAFDHHFDMLKTKEE